MRKIDKKLLHCHNLLLNPSSRQYQDAAAQQRDKAAQRKATKVRIDLTFALLGKQQIRQGQNTVVSVRDMAVLTYWCQIIVCISVCAQSDTFCMLISV